MVSIMAAFVSFIQFFTRPFRVVTSEVTARTESGLLSYLGGNCKPKQKKGKVVTSEVTTNRTDFLISSYLGGNCANLLL